MRRIHALLIPSIAPGLLLANVWLGTPDTSHAQQAAKAGQWRAGRSSTAAQTVGTILTAASTSISSATLGLNRSASPETRKFAQGLLRDHTALVKAALELAHRLQIEPAISELNAGLAQHARRMLDELARLKGPEFERDYIPREIGYLEAALGAVEALESGDPGNAELESLLARARSTLEAELERARKMGLSRG